MRCNRRHVLGLLGGTLAGAMWLPRSASARTAAQLIVPTGVARDLDNDASAWRVTVDPPERVGQVRWELVNVAYPSGDGRVLRLAVLPGTSPYTSPHIYRSIRPTPVATAFQLELRYRFTPATSYGNRGGPSRIQALEFVIGKRTSDPNDPNRPVFFEWAAQWQNVGDDTPERGNPPTWRLWTDGKRWTPDGRTQIHWQDTGLRQELQADVWHDLLLQGDVTNGKVRYVRLVSDGQALLLGHTYDPRPAPEPLEQIDVAFQPDVNHYGDPYEVFLDRFSLAWFQDSPW